MVVALTNLKTFSDGKKMASYASIDLSIDNGYYRLVRLERKTPVKKILSIKSALLTALFARPSRSSARVRLALKTRSFRLENVVCERKMRMLSITTKEQKKPLHYINYIKLHETSSMSETLCSILDSFHPFLPKVGKGGRILRKRGRAFASVSCDAI